MTQKGQNKDVRTRFWAVTQPAEGENGVSRQELEKALKLYDYLGQEEIGETEGSARLLHQNKNTRTKHIATG